MSRWLLAALAAVAPISSFEDDFERADGAVGGAWLVGAPTGPGPVVDGGMVTQGEASNFWESLVWSEPLGGDAIWLEVDMADAAQDLMLVLHHDGQGADSPAENNGYGLRWQPFDQRVTVLENGEYRGPHPTSGGPYSGPHTVRAEWDGVDHLTVLVDGTPVMEWTDEDTTLGGPERRRVGVMFPPINAPVDIDAIRAGTLDEPASASADPPPPATDAPGDGRRRSPRRRSRRHRRPRPPPRRRPPSQDRPAPPATVTTGTANEFLPDRDLDECISALPQPDCGSESQGGWRQVAIFGLLAAALAFIAWRIVRSARRRQSGPRPMTPDEFRRRGHELIDWIADYVEGVEKRPVAPPVAPGDVRRQLPAHPPAAPESWDAVMADLDGVIVPGIVHWQHPSFFAYFPSNTTYPSILGELVAAGLGVQGMSWVTSPACTELETLVLDWMVELLGLPERFRSDSAAGGGVIQGSASEATLTAILAARWRATGGAVNTDGDTTRLVAYATSQAHSSIEKGLRIAGVGTDHLRTVAHDESFAMRPEALAEAIAADRAAGLVPFFVCATRGTTSSMAFDPTPALGDDLRRCRGVAARRRGDERHRRPGAGASLGQRRAGARRQLLHEPAQVDGRQLRLRPVLDGRSRGPARRPQHPPRVPPLGRRRDRVRRSTTATGRCRSDAGSGRSSCG